MQKPSDFCTKTVLHRSSDLEYIFKKTFFKAFNTIIVGGAEEPLYEPSKQVNGINCIYYRHNYYSSALHEIAHWCIAGEARRLKVDYGYWYSPDGRNKQEQLAFENVECKPQAIECAFSMAVQLRFRVSIDNLAALENTNSDDLLIQEQRFEDRVKSQLAIFIKKGFPPRAQMFLANLHQFYQTPTLSKWSF